MNPMKSARDLATPRATATARPQDVYLIKLDGAELTELCEAVHRQVQVLMSEVAGTESHTLQRELAHSIDRLETVARKLDEVARASAFITS